MKIIFTPDYRKGNLYQTNLTNSLLKQGVSIYFTPEFHPKKMTSLFAIMAGVSKCWRPDIVHIHWSDPFLISSNKFVSIIKSTGFICELLILKAFGSKLVWTVHNISGHEDKSDLQLLFTKLLARLNNRLISHCSSASNEIKRLYGKNLQVTVIPHGNYIRQYKNDTTRAQARNVLKLDEKDIVFLHFGYIRPYKGILELINAFKKIENQNAKLLIVGKPFDDKTANEININSNDRRIKNILRFIPDDDIQIYMNAADVIVLPYKNILTSGTAILSMSFGKPIIAPAIGCIPDIIDEKGGFLYKEENELSRVLEMVINTDRNTLLNMGKYNLETVEQFEWNKIGKKTFEIYQECIDGKKNGVKNRDKYDALL